MSVDILPAVIPQEMLQFRLKYLFLPICNNTFTNLIEKGDKNLTIEKIEKMRQKVKILFSNPVSHPQTQGAWSDPHISPIHTKQCHNRSLGNVAGLRYSMHFPKD